MSAAGAPEAACGSEHCITCGDDGVPMRVLAEDRVAALALCADEAGGRHTVQIDLVGDVSTGDAVLVHAGVALVRLDEAPR